MNQFKIEPNTIAVSTLLNIRDDARRGDARVCVETTLNKAQRS